MQAKPSAPQQGNSISAKPPAATTANSYQTNTTSLGNSQHATFKPPAKPEAPNAKPIATETTSLLGLRQKLQPIVNKSSDAVPETPAKHWIDPRGWF